MNNRSQIRWAPFQSLFQTTEIIQELNKKRKQCQKPTLSEDELNYLEQTIIRANHTKELILIDYYFNGFIYQKTGIITNIKKNDLKIFFQDHSSLYFEQIIHIKII